MTRFLVAAMLRGVLAQRLVRKICPHCRHEVPPSDQLLEESGLTRHQIEGVSFFDRLDADVALHLLEARAYRSGMVALRYGVRHASRIAA